MENKIPENKRTDLIIKAFYDDLTDQEATEVQELEQSSLIFKEDLAYFQSMKDDGVDIKLQKDVNQKFQERFRERLQKEAKAQKSGFKIKPYLIAASVSILLLLTTWTLNTDHLGNQYQELVSHLKEEEQIQELPLLPVLFKEELCNIVNDPESFLMIVVIIEGTIVNLVNKGEYWLFDLKDPNNDSCTLKVMSLDEPESVGKVYQLKGMLTEVQNVLGFKKVVFVGGIESNDP